MYIESVDPGAISVCLSEDELKERGVLCPPCAGDAREIVRAALRNRGEAPWPDMEIELFSSRSAVLIIARPAHFNWSIVFFDNAEDMLSAALACPDKLPSSLYCLDGGYYLAVRNGHLPLPCQIFEFGRPHTAGGFLYHLREHGICIAGNRAVDILKGYFG
jgi:hypothetical protein